MMLSLGCGRPAANGFMGVIVSSRGYFLGVMEISYVACAVQRGISWMGTCHGDWMLQFFQPCLLYLLTAYCPRLERWTEAGAIMENCRQFDVDFRFPHVQSGILVFHSPAFHALTFFPLEPLGMKVETVGPDVKLHGRSASPHHASHIADQVPHQPDLQIRGNSVVEGQCRSHSGILEDPSSVEKESTSSRLPGRTDARARSVGVGLQLRDRKRCICHAITMTEINVTKDLTASWGYHVAQLKRVCMMSGFSCQSSVFTNICTLSAFE